MKTPKVVVDFNNADAKGRLRLDTKGTLRDLERQHIQPAEGLALTLYMDDADAEGRPQQMVIDGVVEYSDDDKCWVAAIDWDAIRYVTAVTIQAANGADSISAMPTPSRTNA